MSFEPNKVKISYGVSINECIAICSNNAEYVGEKIKLTINRGDCGVITPVITAMEDITPSCLDIVFNIPEELLDEDLYYYYATFTTNDIASVFQHKQKPLQLKNECQFENKHAHFPTFQYQN